MSSRDRAEAWLRARIAALPPPQGPGDWPRRLELSAGVLLVAGDNVSSCFVNPEGDLFEADRDAVTPRLEYVADPERRRSVLREAIESNPELAPLLDPPAPTEGQLEVLSADGRWRASVHDDFDVEGGEVTVLELFDVASSRRTCLLQLRDPSLRLVRFLEARRLLLVDADGFVEVAVDASRPRRRIPSAGSRAATTPSLATSPPATPPRQVPERFVGELIAEPSLVSMFVFLWVAGLAPIVPAVTLLIASSGEARLRAVVWFAGSVAMATMFVRIALRPRIVAITSDGVMVVSWGRRLPLPMKRIVLETIEDVLVAREARFAVSARGGRAPGMKARPDRWRIEARFANGRTIDVGTTGTEPEAVAVRERLLAWRAASVG